MLRYPYDQNARSNLEFLTDVNWGGVLELSKREDFFNLDRDIEGAAKRWKAVVESETPEREKLPQEWKTKTPFQRLCIMRCLRMDRMTYAVK